MNLSSYILQGFAILPKQIITINSNDYECVFNNALSLDRKHFGGLVDDATTTVSVKTSLLTNPKELKGKPLTMNGTVYRIVSVTVGDAITHISFVSKDAT